MLRKKIFTLFSVGTVIVSSVSLCYADSFASDTEAEKIQALVEELIVCESVDEAYLENETVALVQDSNISAYIENYYSEGEYPESYAGSYIDKSGNLVVCITDSSEDIKEEYIEIAGSNVQFQVVDTSFEKLMDLYNLFEDMYESNYDRYVDQDVSELQVYSTNESYAEMLQSMTGYYIDEEENALVVEIDDLTPEKEKVFNELFSDDPCIVFQEGDKFTATTINWKPGRTIYLSSGGYMSTGYRAYWYSSSGTKYTGFTTAGHGVSSGASIYTSSSHSTTLGKCKTSVFSDDTDCAFIAITNSNYAPSNTVFYKNSSGDTGGVSLSTTAIMSSYTTGGTIYKAGATTYLTSGIIKSTNATVTYDGCTLTDMLKTTALNLKGDSGGVAYVYYNNTSYVVAGTMSGSSYSGDALTEDTFKYSYISKVKNQKTTMGVYVY